MDILYILFTIFCFLIGMLTLYIAFRYYRKYHSRILLLYLCCLIPTITFGFLDIVGRGLIAQFLSYQTHSSHTVMSVGLIINLIGIPISFLAAYVFIALIRSFFNKKVTKEIKIGYIVLSTAIVVAFAYIIRDYATRGEVQFTSQTEFFLTLFNATAVIITLLAISQIFIFVKEIPDKEKKSTLKNYGYIYLTLSVLVYVLTNAIKAPSIQAILYPFLYFSIHLPPLLYFKKYLDLYYKGRVLSEQDETKLENFFNQYGISKREKEIISLILKGKNNKEIHRELFISVHTVRNHISNIYNKLNVKNRLQLTNMVRNIHTCE